jgi:hypothetical protein
MSGGGRCCWGRSHLFLVRITMLFRIRSFRWISISRPTSKALKENQGRALVRAATPLFCRAKGGELGWGNAIQSSNRYEIRDTKYASRICSSGRVSLNAPVTRGVIGQVLRRRYHPE